MEKHLPQFLISIFSQMLWLAIGLAVPEIGTVRVKAEILPIKTYTVANGLAQNNVNRITFDSRGFVWFCTNEGVSRFDGYKFTNFGIDQGLPTLSVYDMVEGAHGEYWLATSSGLVRFNPAGKSETAATTGKDTRFTVISVNDPASSNNLLITSLAMDRTGRLWCGSEMGLLQLVRSEQNYELIPTRIWDANRPSFRIQSLLLDRQDRLWAGALGRVFLRLPDGTIEEYGAQQGVPNSDVMDLYEDRRGGIWAGTGKGLWELYSQPKTTAPLLKRLLVAKDGIPGNWVRDIWQSPDGQFYVATDRGLCRFTMSADGQLQPIIVYTKENGLSDYFIKQVSGDRHGNLWLGTANAGAMTLYPDGFTSIGFEAGVPAVVSIQAYNDNETYLIGYVPIRDSKNRATDFQWRLGRLADNQISWLRPNVPPDVKFSYGWKQVSFKDRQGEWWIATQAGLYRFPRTARFEDLARVKPKAVYNNRNGLSHNYIERLFEDSKGDIWIATNSPEANSLDRWERATEQIQKVSLINGQELLGNRSVTAICEDRSGALWLGLSGRIISGGLARYAQGKITTFDNVPMAPKSNVFDLFIDHTGKLWLATATAGASSITDPCADEIQFTNYTAANGLSSDRVTSLAEDNFGRLYFGTGKGVDQLDQRTSKFRHYSNTDGLPLGGIDDILRDRQGSLWFATTQGLSRFNPKPDPLSSAPTIYIDNLWIRGEAQAISALGETLVHLPTLGPDDNQIEIEYVGLGAVSADEIIYQCMLEGVDSEWRPQTRKRSINFAYLAPGTYRFMVRAINANGEFSKTPAVVSFTVAAPAWQRWWFIALILGLLLSLTYIAYSYRVRQLLALERMRSRIATDLHDEVGSNLSQIAILIEVARQRLKSNLSGIKESEAVNYALEPMEKVATTSREAVDAMSDIVWAINPLRDHLSDLSQRMRRFASETLTARSIDLSFQAPQQDLNLDVEVRRQVFLIFKESVNNIVRHSQAEKVEVVFELDDNQLCLSIRDNGCGFIKEAEPLHQNTGNGLHSMRRRAQELGGRLDIISIVGKGTIISLSAPLRPPRKHKITT